MHETMVFVQERSPDALFRAYTIRTKRDADKLRGLRSEHVVVVTAGRPEGWSQELHNYLLKDVLASIERDGALVSVAHGCP